MKRSKTLLKETNSPHPNPRSDVLLPIKLKRLRIKACSNTLLPLKISWNRPKSFVGKLTKLKIKKLAIFYCTYRFRYEDFSQIKNIADLIIGEKTTITVKILNISQKRVWKRNMTITEALLEDETAPIMAVWFNQPYLTNTLKKVCG